MSKAWLWAVLGGLLLIGGKTVYDQYQQRGICNNNPGNIRPSQRPWMGQNGIDTAAGGPFLTFASPLYGLRAMARVLDTYRKRGVTSVRAIVSHWAPASDHNNTAAYIAAVSARPSASAPTPP